MNNMLNTCQPEHVTQTNFPYDGYVTDKDIACFIGITPQTVWAWVRQGKFPQPIKFSTKCTRWNAATVREHMISMEVNN